VVSARSSILTIRLADLHRRAEVSQKALDCYCDALSAVDDSATLQELTAGLERSVRWHGKPIRALHPFHPDDHALLRAVNRGEFTIHGLRNRDLQQLFYPQPPTTVAEKRRRSAAIGRKLRMPPGTRIDSQAATHTSLSGH
jgi:hypothetical protein